MDSLANGVLNVNIQDRFERKHKLPEGVYFSRAHDMYMSDKPIMYAGVTLAVNQLFQGYKSGVSESDWLDIRSAPTDGTHIHLYYPHQSFIGYFSQSSMAWIFNAPGLPQYKGTPTKWKHVILPEFEG